MITRKQITLFLIVLSILIGLAGCAKSVFHTKYYIIDYIPHKKVTFTKARPFPVKIMVTNMNISSLYDTSKIIIRNSMHQIEYSNYALWPLRPQYAIRDLLMQHIQINEIFVEIDKEFLNTKPDYIIRGHISNLEFYFNEELGLNKANLDVKYTLEQYQTGKTILTHHIRRSDSIGSGEMVFFVKKISDILNEENQKFIRKLKTYFSNKFDKNQR